MDCTAFQECLFAGLEGRLDAAIRERMEAHAASCSDCRELELLVTGDEGRLVDRATLDNGAGVGPPADLVNGVLARTSGGSCERAASLLSERADAEADATSPEAALLQMHLETCPECAALGRALERLDQELSGLAELQPDDAFVADVMAATVGATRSAPILDLGRSGAAVRVPQPVAAWWASVADLGERLVNRPRLAFEGAFVATVMLFLIAGLPSTSMAELPARTFDQIGQGRAEIEAVALTKLGELADLGRSTLSAAAERVTASFPTDESTSVGSRRFGDRLMSWVTAGIEFVDKLFSDFKETLTNLINTRRNT